VANTIVPRCQQLWRRRQAQRLPADPGLVVVGVEPCIASSGGATGQEQ